jgi:hypothetical protein
MEACCASATSCRNAEGAAGLFSMQSASGRLGSFHFLGETCVPIGTLKWFNPTKGYDFIQPDNGGNRALQRRNTTWPL